jgi:hypothetical protein
MYKYEALGKANPSTSQKRKASFCDWLYIFFFIFLSKAQDLLRSRWLSLAKNGHSKSALTQATDSSPKPVVDVSLKEDSVKDFEDKEMEGDDGEKVNEEKVEGEKVDEGEVDKQTTDELKQEEQDRNVGGSQIEEKLSDQTTERKTQEGQNDKENIEMDGKEINK